MNKLTVTVVILLIGLLYRLTLTADGNFLFNMDNGRDMVDVREMVELKKFRLTGPTSAVEGLFNGPIWYYLLAIPFILSDGDPYGSILLEMVLWAVGGFFLLKLTSRFGVLALVVSGVIWVASNYIVLASVYAFNPNPVTFLTPLLIYLIEKYLTTKKLVYSILMWFLGGLFFNFEMNFGVYVPPIIFLTIVFSKRGKLIKERNLWLGFLIFVAVLLPQVIFDLRHQFIMSKSVLHFLSESEVAKSFNQVPRIKLVYESFFNTLSATFFNQKILTQLAVILFLFSLFKFLKKRKEYKEVLFIICIMFILIPFIGYILLPVQVNPWHLGAEMVATIFLVSAVLSILSKLGLIARGTSLIISGLIIFYAVSNLFQYFTHDRFQANLDPSSYKNEIAAIDYVYQKAEGNNFKVYTYLPSVIDYPYQYLFWWHGQKRYGYIPGEYAYSPNKPQYISNKEQFEGRKDNFSGLIFLIKEPDRIGYRTAWEGDFRGLEFISKEMVGPLEVEIRRAK